MKNIHITRKFFIVLLIFAIAMMILGLFVGCANEPYKADVAQDNNRFQIVYSQGPDITRNTIIDIIIDKETNVKYVFVKNGYGAGLTKLEE